MRLNSFLLREVARSFYELEHVIYHLKQCLKPLSTTQNRDGYLNYWDSTSREIKSATFLFPDTLQTQAYSKGNGSKQHNIIMHFLQNPSYA